MIKIDIIAVSTLVSDDEAKAAVAALQTQISRDWEPVWGVPALLTFIPHGGTPDPNHWWLSLLDDADQADCLGYHDITSVGLPLGKTFVKTAMQNNGKWTVTLSHECLEMLGDPDINLSAYVLSEDQSKLLFYAYEVSDAVESDDYGYDIDGITVSDFVTPAFFEPTCPAGVPLDFKGHVQRPLQILPGGYLSVLDPMSGMGWQQIYGAKARLSSRYRGKLGSRREKRRTRRSDWRRSTPK